MPEETIENKNDPENHAKQYTEDEVNELINKAVMGRLKGVKEENEALKQQLAAGQESSQKPSVSSPGVNASDLQDMLADQFREQQEAQLKREQEASQNQFVQTNTDKLRKMMSEDKDFGTLIGSEGANDIDQAVGLHIVSQFEPNTAKKILSNLITNKDAQSRMQNAYLKSVLAARDGEENADRHYNNWFEGLRQPSTPVGDAPSIEDLSQNDTSSREDPYSDWDDYMLT